MVMTDRPITITQQPQAQTVCEAAAATFSVTGVGQGTIT